jgi:excisionase family DNA binding protein
MDAELEKFLAELRERLSRIEERLQPTPTCLPFPEAAQKLGVGLTKLKELVRSGELRTSTVGKRQMVSLAELERLSTPDNARAKVQQKQHAKAWVPLVKRQTTRKTR